MILKLKLIYILEVSEQVKNAYSGYIWGTVHLSVTVPHFSINSLPKMLSTLRSWELSSNIYFTMTKPQPASLPLIYNQGHWSSSHSTALTYHAVCTFPVQGQHFTGSPQSSSLASCSTVSYRCLFYIKAWETEVWRESFTCLASCLMQGESIIISSILSYPKDQGFKQF